MNSERKICGNHLTKVYNTYLHANLTRNRNNNYVSVQLKKKSMFSLLFSHVKNGVKMSGFLRCAEPNLLI